MTAISPQVCRAFVNSIVSRFDGDEHVDIFSAAPSDLFVNEPNGQPHFTEKERLEICAEGGIGRLLAVTKILSPDKKNFIAQLMPSPQKALFEVAAKARLSELRYESDPVSSFYNFYEMQSQLFSHIFARVYSEADAQGKRAILAQLRPFEGQMESVTFRIERLLFKVQRTLVFNDFSNSLKIGLVGAAYIGFHILSSIMQPRVDQFFPAMVVPKASELLSKYGSITLIRFCNQISHLAFIVIARVVNSNIYYWLYCSNFATPLQWVITTQSPLLGYVVISINFIREPVVSILQYLLSPLIPSLKVVLTPISMLGGRISFSGIFASTLLYDSNFAPSARAQERISRSLSDSADSKELLEGGIKAYQVWMHLMLEGPQQGLFKEPD